MKAIIHAGMHKTGSTSIQQTFGRKRLRYHHFPRIGAHNHSHALQALQATTPEEFASLHGDKLTEKQFLKRRQRRIADLQNAICESRKRGALLLSGEYISIMPRGGLDRLRSILAAEFKTIEVIAYVRPPLSYMHSSFQQNLKGSAYSRLAPERFWPGYRRRFAALDDCFGRDNVHLRLFSKDTLTDGDVVKDFAHIIGESLSERDIIRANESLSAEATALLFVQRRYGGGFRRGYSGKLRSNGEFVRKLSMIGSGKLLFDPVLTDPVFKTMEGDLEWMESRLGASLEEKPRSEGERISTEADLVAIATDHEEELDALIAGELEGPIVGIVADPIRRLLNRAPQRAFRDALRAIVQAGLPPHLRLAGKLDVLHDIVG